MDPVKGNGSCNLKPHLSRPLRLLPQVSPLCAWGTEAPAGTCRHTAFAMNSGGRRWPHYPACHRRNDSIINDILRKMRRRMSCHTDFSTAILGRSHLKSHVMFRLCHDMEIVNCIGARTASLGGGNVRYRIELPRRKMVISETDVRIIIVPDLSTLAMPDRLRLMRTCSRTYGKVTSHPYLFRAHLNPWVSRNG